VATQRAAYKRRVQDQSDMRVLGFCLYNPDYLVGMTVRCIKHLIEYTFQEILHNAN
jgi:hypothetical protein